MSRYLFEENIKQSRKKALFLTVLFHIFVVCAVWVSTLGNESPIKTNMNQWITKFTGEETTDNDYNVRP